MSIDITIPSYLNEKGNVVRLVLGTAIFSLLFINIFQPFNSRGWYPNINDFTYFLFSSLIILTAMCVIAISRTVMYFYAQKRPITLLSYIIWVILEVLSMSFFYTLFPLFVLHVDVGFADLYKLAITYTCLIVLLPYSIFWLYFALQDKKRIIQQLGATAPQAQVGQLSFADEKGEIRLAITADCLFYIEAADNYIDIHYTNKGVATHYLLRNTLKHIEQNFAERGLLRCHRSYVVNIHKAKVIRKANDGLYIDFDCEGIPHIPISKTFSNRIMEAFVNMNA